jgi:hypothetical protein
MLRGRLLHIHILVLPSNPARTAPTPCEIFHLIQHRKEMTRDVRILLAGDGTNNQCALTRLDGVGKSTLITSLIKESFVSNVTLLSTHHAV